MSPVSVIDIGSNSVRVVIYEGLSRAPAILFNEKAFCGLGRGIGSTGRMEEEAVARALVSLKRFRALSEQARATGVFVLATAAAREASNGPDFIRAAEAILGQRIFVLSGEEEAHYSALGVISAFYDTDGIAGDLGGGSLELVDIRRKSVGQGTSLPLGGLRLSETSGNSLSKARSFARKQVAAAQDLLESGAGRVFYAVGGTWRNMALLHMEMNAYPLHMIQGYEVEAGEMAKFLEDVVSGKLAKHPAWQVVSKSRRALMPYGAIAMQEVMARMKPARIAFSAQGVREGYLYSLLSEDERLCDPLLVAADELAILRARSPEHARELAAWTGRMMPLLGFEETAEESRYRQAACLMADISWRAHPDYRGLQALNVIAHSSLIGISHAGRAYLALANYYRFDGLSDNGTTQPLASLAGERLLLRAKLLGGLLRVVYLFSASMPGIVDRLTFRPAVLTDADLELVVPAGHGDFAGERLDGRLQQLAKLIGRRLAFVFE